MDGPYRQAPGATAAEAESRNGSLRLWVGPEVCLALGPKWRLTLSGSRALVSRRGAGRRGWRRRELDLDRVGLYLARTYPGRGLAVWCETELDRVERLGGARALSLLEPGGLAAGRALDRLAAAAARALNAARGDTRSALELGAGGHRVLLVDRGERLVLYARPLFRERPRRVLEVCHDGGLVLPGRGRRGDVRSRFSCSRYRVTAAGDRILFAGDDGGEVMSLWLPWIGPDERAELARRFGALVDPAAPEPARHERPKAEPGSGLRPWRSGLGRRPPVAAFRPLGAPFLRR